MGRQGGVNLIAFGIGTLIAYYGFGITDPLAIIGGIFIAGVFEILYDFAS